MISPFQYGYNRRNAIHQGSHSRIRFISKPHAAERVIAVSIESCGDDEQVRRELLQRREDFSIKRFHVALFARTGGQGNIQRKAFPPPDSPLFPRPRTRIKWILMQADVENCRIILKDMLGTIPVVHVPIKNSNFLHAVPTLGIARTNCNVIEQAEAHRPVTLGMMTRWTNGAERSVDLSFLNSINGRDNRTRRKHCSIERFSHGVRVSFIQHAAAAQAYLLQYHKVLATVNRKNIVFLRRTWLEVREVLPQGRLLQVLHKMAKPFGTFRMSRRRAMREKLFVINKSDACHEPMYRVVKDDGSL